jgi:Fe2+ or Zn2+ uptake regulation protein
MGSDPADLLRERGIQVTAQRLAVLRAVAGHPHIAADGVVEIVRAEIGAISLQSVYDALAVLVAGGLIRRIQPAGSPARFENRVGDNHHHLICRVCGRMVDVDCAVGSAPCLTPVDDKGYEIDETQVVYWGRCPDCVGQARAPFGSDVPARGRESSQKRDRSHDATIPSTLRQAHGRPQRSRRATDPEENAPDSPGRAPNDPSASSGSR